MKIVGLVGQVCSGKSTVANVFLAAGADVYDADAHIHELYKDPFIIKQVAIAFPEAVVALNVDRKALAAIAFKNPVKMNILKDIVWPHTGQEILHRIKLFKESNKKILLLNAPTLCESNRHTLCDQLLFISAPFHQRIEWAKKRGWSTNEIKRRDALLLPESEKRSLCHIIIENSGTEEDLKLCTQRILQHLEEN